jgi:phosphoribosylglycinamide formyltransferase-1
VSRRQRTAILISGLGSNMRALIEAARRPSFPAEIALVLSNRREAEGLAYAKDHGIATAVIDHKIYAGREAFEGSMQAMLVAHRIEFLCLAGFMRLLTAHFVARWHGRILNIHPALLPAYRGLNTHIRALQDGVKIHGCTAHFVVPAMDEGPIVAQAAVPVLDQDTAETLALRVLRQEHIIYPYALELVASGKVEVVGNRVRILALTRVSEALRVPRREL